MVKAMNISKGDEIDVLTLTLQQLNVLEQIKFVSKPNSKVRNLLPYTSRKAVWDFWHQNSFESTNTSQIAKLRVDNKSRIQDGLDFSPSVVIIKQRNRNFYQSIYKIVQDTFKTLYLKYTKENPGSPVSP